MTCKQIDRLFTAGSRDLDHHENNGAGLALSISYEMATIMNAKISVESELGKGTAFFLLLKEQG
ncbi:aerobic respiration control sensor protein ArcB [compost metagenome]